MSTLRILHISDLHWAKSKANDQRIVVDALLADLRTLCSEGLKPDLVLFTGDLVQAGDHYESFVSVYEHFLSRLHAALDPAPLIVLPGNHDIQREVVRAGGGFVQSGLRAQLSSVDAVNALVDALASGETGTAAALERMGNYERAYPTFGCTPSHLETPLLKIYKLSLASLEVGVAAFNTAWRSSGEADNIDRHYLILGERNVDQAASALSDCDLRIAAFHHPLDWLADFDNVAVSSRLQSEFDLLAFGHSHLSRPEMRITTVGSAVLSQAGCLYENRDYFNGYQFVTFYTEQDKVDFHIRTYFNRPRRVFDKAVDIAPEGKITLPYKGRAQKRNDVVDTFLREIRPVVRQAAIDQVSIVEAIGDLRLDPKEAFICPPLTTHRTTNLRQGARKTEDEITAEEILRSGGNFLISGPRESGKSTLAHYMAVLAVEGAIDRPRIPAVLDFREVKVTAYGLNRAIATYFGAAKQGLNIDERLAAGDFIIIVDNYSGQDRAFCQAMTDLIIRYPRCRWILVSDSIPGTEMVKENPNDLLGDFTAVHIQTLPRKSIRQLSRRWCVQAGLDEQKAFLAIMVQLREANLPRTGYMVTLLLWALYEEREFERLNEAVLLTYVIDHLLGKADFSQALKRNFDPLSKEITLQYVASVLRNFQGIMPKNDILSALITFFQTKGLQYDAAEVLGQLIECGLLKDQDGLVSFKYRCFQEYFFANLLRNDSASLESALSGRNFLGYAREIELLSGLRRQNKDILTVLQVQIKAGAPEELKKFDPETFEEVAAEETNVNINRRRLHDIQQKKLTSDQVDDLMDAADQEAAKRETDRKESATDSTNSTPATNTDESFSGSRPEPMSPENFLSALDLLGRVTRNSEFTDAVDKKSAARLHVESSIRVMLLYADVIKEVLNTVSTSSDKPPPLTPDDAKGARYIIRKWLVIFYGIAVAEQIGTENLFIILEEMFFELSSSRAERLFIALLFLELGHPKWLTFWDSTIKDAKNDRFTLDLLMDRLYHLIHTRVLSDSERRKVEAAAEKIDAAFGIPRRESAASIQNMRQIADQTALNS